MRDRIWISFDLSVGNGLGSMYRWLAGHGARECGPAMATLQYDYKVDIASELRDELRKELPLALGDRVYVIYKDPIDGEVTGMFIIGNRAGAAAPGMDQPHTLTQLH